MAHHVTQRGNNRQDVFFSAGDRRLYLALLARHAARHGVQILGYCLMTNHVHLVAIPRQADSLARTLCRTHSEYALEINRCHERSGHLWQSRFYSCSLDSAHLYEALCYVDLNPVRAGLAGVACEWPWSSARAHCVEGAVDPVLDREWIGQVGGWDHAAWRECLTAAIPDKRWEAVRRAAYTGEPLGSREFVTVLERQAGRRLQVLKRGRPRKPEQEAPDSKQACLFAGTDG
ncbi:MAG: transposase [Acidobacteriota bacterium]